MSSYAWGPGGSPQPTSLLSRQQLAAQHPGIKYQDYVNYVNRTRARRSTARQSSWNQALGPLAALVPTPWQQQQTANAAYPVMTTQQMAERAKTMVSASLDPVIAQITKSYGDATQAGVDRIKSYATGAVTDLKTIAPEIGSAYDTALQQQGALDAALASGMGGAGKSAGGQVSKQAQSMGYGGMGGQSSGALGSLGSGAGNMQFGLGSASESQLISDRASNMTYASEMPNVASLAGQQQVGDYSRTQALALQNAIGEITAKAPGLTQQLIEDYLTQNNTNLAARGAAQQNSIKDLLTAGLGVMGIRSDAAQRALDWRTSQLSAGVTTRGQDVSARTTIQATNLDNAAAWKRAVLASQGKAGSGGLTAAGAQTLENRIATAAGKMRSRIVTRPARNSLGEIPGQTVKTNSPVPNNAVYEMIFRNLYAAYGNSLTDAQYANKVAALAQRGGYAKATAQNVQAVMNGLVGGAPAPGTTPAAPANRAPAAAPGAAPTAPAKRPPTAAAPKAPPAQGKAGYVAAAATGQPKPKAATAGEWAAAKASADREVANAHVWARQALDGKKSVQAAIQYVTQSLDSSKYTPMQRDAIARKAVADTYPHPGYNPPKQVGKTPAQNIATVGQKYGGVDNVEKRKDGSYVVNTGDGRVWKVVGGHWTNIYTPHRVR